MNVPPTVSIDGLAGKVSHKDLARGRLLTVHLGVSEPAMITVEVLNKRGKPLRQLILQQNTGGSFTAPISLSHAKGRLTPRVTATDAGGVSTVVAQQFKAR